MLDRYDWIVVIVLVLPYSYWVGASDLQTVVLGACVGAAMAVESIKPKVKK